LAIDPSFDDALDIAEIGHHIASVEGVGPDFDFRNRVVAMRVLAHAVVIEESMAVAELNPLGDRVHSQ
jgi:hypothetical protein